MMINDIKRAIAKCENCQLNKSKPYPEPTEDIPTEVEGQDKVILDSGYKVFVCPICGIQRKKIIDQNLKMSNSERSERFLTKVKMYKIEVTRKQYGLIKTDIVDTNYICFNCFSKDIDYLNNNILELYKEFIYKRNQYVVNYLLQYNNNKNK